MESQDSLREASFSAYLNPADQESFALKIATVVQEAAPTSMSFEETPRAVSFRRMQTADKFGANKYLNIKMEYKSCKGATAEQKEGVDPSSTVCCSRRIKPKRSNYSLSFFIKGFSWRGPCSGNKSDHVDHVDHGMVLDSTSKCSHNQENHDHDDLSMKLTEEPRKSIEVFGSQAAKKGDDNISKNLERKLSMLTWDAIPKKVPHRLNPSISIETDALSDASSDLFEIEALSGTGQQPVYDLNMQPSMQAADEVSGCMTPTSTQYEPSEVSIDFSFASDFDDRGKAVDLYLIKKEGGS